MFASELGQVSPATWSGPCCALAPEWPCLPQCPDAYFSFYIKAILRKDRSNEKYNILLITNYYIYGSSTRNVRIKEL
jgi:hypothetical protein